MAKLRLTSSGIVDIDYTGSRLTAGGIVKGSPTGGDTTVAVPDIVGDTAAVADGKITGAGLVVGTVTGDIDPVIAQNPAAGTQVALGSAVDYTLTTALGPVARDDGPYHVLENETFTLLAPGILENDDWSTEDLRPHLTFSGSSYATIGTPLTFSGDKSLAFTMSTTIDASVSNGIAILGSTTTPSSVLNLYANDRIRLVKGSTVFDVLYSEIPNWNNGEKHSFRWQLVGSQMYFYYNGAEIKDAYFHSSGDITWDIIAANGNLTGNFIGVLDTIVLQDAAVESQSITWILDSESTTREPSEQHPADSNYDLIYTGVVPGDWS